MFVDWLQYTIKDVYTDSDDIHLLISRTVSSLPYPLQDLLGFHSSEYPAQTYTLSRGVNFYQNALTFASGVKILYNPPKLQMGTNIIIPGTVLREKPLEPGDIMDWFQKILVHYDYNICRVDIAQDTDVDFSYFFDKYQKGEYVTRYLSHSLKSYVDCDNRGTLYFGTRGKGTMIRIYDKYLEQYSQLKSKIHKAEFAREWAGKSWTRLEMECRQDQALQMLDCYINDCCGDVFLGHLRFVEKMQAKTSRCVVDSVYLSVINAKGCRKLSKVKNNELNIDWIIRVAARNLLAIKEVKPRLYNLIMENLEASPEAKIKAYASSRELDRMYFSINNLLNGGENVEELVPVEILENLRFKECV